MPATDSGMQCGGCGSVNVTFDPQRRMLVCNQCGREEYYSRASLCKNSKVAFCQHNAKQFFADGQYEMAERFAHDTINIMLDNTPALYIIAFYDEFTRGRNNALRDFFAKVADTPLEYEEVTDLMDLFLSAPGSLGEYEPQVITVAATNMQDERDAARLCEFIDKLCPYLIARRPSINYMTEELADMYRELAEHCGVPRTCFALLKAIRENPDSPYRDNSFYLKERSSYFYEHFVVPIGKVIMAMAEIPEKDKFVRAYRKYAEQYRQDAQIS